MDCLVLTQSPAIRLIVSSFVLILLLAGAGRTRVLAQAGTGSRQILTANTENEADSETADEEAGDYRIRPGMNEFGFFVGGGPSMATFTGLQPYEASDRYFIQTGVRYGRTVHVGETGALQYMVEATPLNLAFGNVSAPDPATPNVTHRSTVYGFGVAPVGVRYVFRPQAKIKVFGALNLGMVLFSEDLPVPSSRRFNFTTEADAGVMIWSRDNKAVTLGMKFNHISNAGTGELNPGINAAIFYVGYSVFK